MGCYEGQSWVSLGGVGHVELSEGFFGLTPIPQGSAYGEIGNNPGSILFLNYLIFFLI